jgi:predicted PurR-regulated permease PerM
MPDPEDGTPQERNRLVARGVRALESVSTLFWAVAIAIALGLIVATLGDVVMIVFAAVLFAVMLRGAAARTGRMLGIRTGWGLLIVVVGLVALFGGLGWSRGPSLADQAVQLQEGMVRQFTIVRGQMQQTEWGRTLLDELPFGLGTANPGGGAGGVIPHLAGLVAGALWSALGLLGTALVIAAAAIYIAAFPKTYVHGTVNLLPVRRRAPARRVLDNIGATLWGWLVGQFIDMLIVGALCGIGLALLGMPLALILALIAAILNFVPYIGAVAGAVPAVLIALSIGWDEALFVALLYVAVQTLEGNVIAPLVQQRTINLPPALTILSQTAFGVIFGIPGVVLATPFTAAIMATVQSLEREDPDY